MAWEGKRTADASDSVSAEAETLVDRPNDAESDPREDDALTPGTRLGRYVVLEQIGSGGMGVVLAAYDPELNRKVALKLLRPRHRERKRHGNRLIKEAQALARLAHPNVITVYDVGTYGDRVFVAMELVEGDTLRGWLRARQRRYDEVLQVLIPAGRGLAAAHAAGLVHRDFKPENVLIGRDGRVRVMDFGLARPLRSETNSGGRREDDSAERERGDEPANARAAGRTALGDAHLTHTGSVLGTPAYMAPEQHIGATTDARSDQFSFCTTLYHALYGASPFSAENTATLAQQKLEGELADPPPGASVPAWVRRIVVRGLSPEPADRFASMDPLLDELEHDPREKWRRIGAAVAMVAGMTALVGGIQYYRGLRPAVCRGSHEVAAEVWNPARAQAVSRALDEVGRPQLVRTSAAVGAAADRYADAWAVMRTEACEATHLRGEQSGRLLELRNNCLQERLDELDVLAENLGERVTPGMAARAVDAALGLSPLSACADSEALASSVDPPAGEPAKAAVAQLRSDLARVKVLGDLGLHDDALRLAEQAYSQAGSLEYPPVLAEARFRLGQIQGRRGDGEDAQENLSEANWLAAGVKHDATAAAAASELVHVVGLGIGEYEDALGWANHAESAIKRIGVSGLPEARLRHDIGAIQTATGDLAAAETSLSRSLELQRDLPAAAIERVETERDLAAVRTQQGRLDDADALLASAKTSIEDLLGSAHPHALNLEVGRARVLDARGDHRGAIATLHAAIAGLESAIDPADLWLVPILDALAQSHARLGEHAEAVVQKRRIETLLTDALADHPRVAAARYDIGISLEAAGDLDAARTYHERALRLWEKTRGADHPDLAYALARLGMLDVEAGAAGRAVRQLERALKLRGGRGLDPALLAQTQFALARALDATGGDDPRARELATKARDTFAKGKSPDPERADEIARWLARHSAAPPSHATERSRAVRGESAARE